MEVAWPRVRIVPALLCLGWLGLGSLFAASASLPEDPSARPLHMLLYVAGTLGLWVAIPIALFATAFSHALALRGNSLVRWFPLVMAFNSLCFFAFLFTKVGLARVLRAVFNSALGLSVTAPWSLFDELRGELPKDMAHYGCLFAVVLAFRLYERERREAERAARLETKLVEARLEALNARLDPHFIYNALNTLNSLMHVDLTRTEVLFDDLGALLRAVLSEDRPTWTLGEEREHTQRYVDFVEARFGDRVKVHWSLAPELERVTLPRFSILTLVENAVKHNQRERRPVRIEVRAQFGAKGVELAVSDDGVGFDKLPPPPSKPRKGGLDRLAETLELMYGERAALAREHREPSGARVTLTLPEAG